VKAIITLEALIKEDEEQLKLAKKKLADHESGESPLTAFMKISTDNSIEKAQKRLEQSKAMLADLMSQDLQELEEEERLKDELQRRKYFHLQRFRIKHNKIASNDEKIEAMMILDELPSSIEFEDSKILSVAKESLKLNLSSQDTIDQQLKEIKKDFEELLKKYTKDMDIKDLELLNIKIPITVLHFLVLKTNIEQNAQENDDINFNGFPKYEDWWINELWSSHQAYYALYKWKEIIYNQCQTDLQKQSWRSIFNAWLFIKKAINVKGELGFKYNLAFDELINKYISLEEELDENNLTSMENIIKKITIKEDFTKIDKDHNVITKYLQFKKEMLTSS